MPPRSHFTPSGALCQQLSHISSLPLSLECVWFYSLFIHLHVMPNFLIVPSESRVSGAKVGLYTVETAAPSPTCVINRGSSQSELKMTGPGCWPVNKQTVIYAACSTWLDQWEAVEVRRVAFMQRSINHNVKSFTPQTHGNESGLLILSCEETF